MTPRCGLDNSAIVELASTLVRILTIDYENNTVRKKVAVIATRRHGMQECVVFVI